MAVKRYNGTAWVVEAGAAAPLPSGMLAPFAGSTAPTGWLLSDGSAVSRTTYSALFTAIGTTYGVGDNSTTFNLPDLRGRGVAGLDNMGGTDAGRLDVANTAGTVTGVQYVTLTAAQSGLPAHSHGVSDPGHSHYVSPLWGNGSSTAHGTMYTSTMGNALYTGGSTTGISISNNSAANASSAHDNMQPTMVMNYIIKV
jgi:microcystin-dependent protein